MAAVDLVTGDDACNDVDNAESTFGREEGRVWISKGADGEGGGWRWR